MQTTGTSTFQKRPWVLFLLILVSGIAVLLMSLILEAKIHSWGIVAQFGEHLGSAIIVAAIMGLTYEWFVHQKTTATFSALLATQKQQMDSGFAYVAAEVDNIRQSVQAVRADDVFKLVHDIAAHRQRIPTLYSPPRDKHDEFVFTTGHDFFRRLIANPTERQSTVDILREWLDEDKPLKFRFLASEFVGLLQLRELAPVLLERFEARKASWTSLKDPLLKGCLLNYAWAASRCDKPPYRYLTNLLLNTPYADVQEWILFVPQQMHDSELRDMISDYVDTRGSSLSKDLLKHVVAAMKALHSEGRDMSALAGRHREVFASHHLLEDLDDAVGVAVDGSKRWWNKLRDRTPA
jgi:hypothetical protein